MLSDPSKTILRDFGQVLHIPGFMALATLPVALWFGEFYALGPFLLTAVIALALGQLLYRLFRHSQTARLPHAMVIAALSWGIVPLLGALPFLLISAQSMGTTYTSPTLLRFQQLENAFFEGMAGFTSAGLTMSLHPSELPHTLQWWRSFMQWIGGIGVIVLMLTVLRPGADAYWLYRSEGRQRKILPNLDATVRAIWWIYLIYTAASILLFFLSGMPPWEAINHGLAGISTGGFTITDKSIGSYGMLAQVATLPVMVLGAISFATHHQVLRRGEWGKAWRQLQPRTLFLLLGWGAILLLLENWWYIGSPQWMDSIFQWTSALSTTGFGTADLAGWSPTALLLLTLAMIVGGAAGSTAGGIKLTRIAVFFRGLQWHFRRVYSRPHELVRYKLGNEVLSEVDANRRVAAAGILVTLWMIVLTAGVIVMLHVAPEEYTLSHVIFETASALSSVGLSTGITHPDLAVSGKLTLAILMWMGRLEIVPVLILFSWPLSALRQLADTLRRGVTIHFE